MGIDTSIYQNLLRTPKSVAEYDAEAQQGQQNKLLLQMNRQKADEYTRGVDRTNKLTGLLGSFKPGMSASDQGDALTRGGYLDEARKVIESGAKVNKDQREAEKFQFEQAREQLGFVNQVIGAAKDQASYSQGRQAMAARGMDVSQIPEQFDPAYVQAAGAQTMTQAQRIEQEWKAKGYDLDVQKFGETVRNNKEQTAVSTANNKRSVGASYANAAATRAIAGATRDAAAIQRDMQTEMKLGDDYRKQSKDFKDIGDAYRTINATLDKATKSPAATLAGATKFMKLLDPGSVVRESELGMALAATGVFDRAMNYTNTLQMGKVLTPNQVKDFKKITEQIYAAAQVGQRDIDASYTKQAQQYKLRPDMIVQELGQNAKPITAPNPKGAKFLGFE